MSGKLVGLVMRGVHGVSANAKRVLIVLAEHCPRESSPVYPGAERIGDFLGIGERMARFGLTELERAGWIVKFPKTGHGRGNPAKYLVDFEAMREPAAEYDRTRAKVAAKAADVLRNNAADVLRLWTDDKRKKLRGKPEFSANKPEHVVAGNRSTSAVEPELTVLQPVLNLAHASGSANPSEGQPPFKKVWQVNGKTPTRSERRADNMDDICGRNRNPGQTIDGNVFANLGQTLLGRKKAKPAKPAVRREETEAQRIERLEAEKVRVAAIVAAAAMQTRGTTQ